MLTRTALFRLGLWAAITISAACGDASEPSGPPGEATVASVRVTPATATVVMGRTQALTATPLDASGQAIEGRTITWSSAAPEIATVSQEGVVTGIAEGEAGIRATADGRQGVATVLVTAPAVERVDLDRVTLQLEEGTVDRFVATPRDAEGAPIPGRVVIWTTSDASVVEVSVLGDLAAIHPGTATITARVHGKVASAQVNVSAQHAYDLVFSAWAGEPGVGPDLMMVDPRDARREARPLRTPALKGTSVAASPDGLRIAFTAIDPWARTDLYVFDRATGEVTRLTEGNAADDQPAWSPDGTRIAFRRQPFGGAGQIWVIEAKAGAIEQRLLPAPVTGPGPVPVPLPIGYAWPAWSTAAGGEPRIAFARAFAGVSHIWTMAENGTDLRQVTAGEVYDEQPAWSPDGTTIAFTRPGITMDIWIVGAAGANPRPVVNLLGQQFRPAFSPDGKLLAFLSSHETGTGRFEIYTVRATDSRFLARRTADPSDKSMVSWARRP